MPVEPTADPLPEDRPVRWDILATGEFARSFARDVRAAAPRRASTTLLARRPWSRLSEPPAQLSAWVPPTRSGTLPPPPRRTAMNRVHS